MCAYGMYRLCRVLYCVLCCVSSLLSLSLSLESIRVGSSSSSASVLCLLLCASPHQPNQNRIKIESNRIESAGETHTALDERAYCKHTECGTGCIAFRSSFDSPPQPRDPLLNGRRPQWNGIHRRRRSHRRKENTKRARRDATRHATHTTHHAHAMGSRSDTLLIVCMCCMFRSRKLPAPL